MVKYFRYIRSLPTCTFLNQRKTAYEHILVRHEKCAERGHHSWACFKYEPDTRPTKLPHPVLELNNKLLNRRKKHTLDAINCRDEPFFEYFKFVHGGKATIFFYFSTPLAIHLAIIRITCISHHSFVSAS